MSKDKSRFSRGHKYRANDGKSSVATARVDNSVLARKSWEIRFIGANFGKVSGGAARALNQGDYQIQEGPKKDNGDVVYRVSGPVDPNVVDGMLAHLQRNTGLKYSFSQG